MNLQRLIGLRPKAETAAAVREAAEAAERELASARETVARLEAARTAALLGAPEAALAKAECELRDARGEAERLALMAEGLRARVPELERAEMTAATRAALAEAEREAATVAAEIGRDYPRLARELAALLAREWAAERRCIAAARAYDAAVRANAMPEGEAMPLPPHARYWRDPAGLASGISARVSLPALAGSPPIGSAPGFWPAPQAEGER